MGSCIKGKGGVNGAQARDLLGPRARGHPPRTVYERPRRPLQGLSVAGTIFTP